jgi:hypothetical protein
VPAARADPADSQRRLDQLIIQLPAPVVYVPPAG